MGFLSTVSQYKYRKILFSDFLTDTPEIMRENILCELEGIAQYFGKFTSKNLTLTNNSRNRSISATTGKGQHSRGKLDSE